jgi:hypothetical protein
MTREDLSTVADAVTIVTGLLAFCELIGRLL